MDKRRRKRFARRLQIRYWPRGEEHARKGYTTNISTTGTFVATNAPVAPGARLRIEFLGEGGFMVEAIVAHAARVSTSLQSIRSSGMGVRFLTISELIRELLPPGGEHETQTVEEAAREKALLEAEAKGELAHQQARGERQTARRPKAAGAPIFTVGFRNVAYLLDAIQSEIAFGGIFVPTNSPAGLQEDVRIALALPAPIKRTIHAEAVVVSVNDPASKQGSSTVKGMGVAFADSGKVLAELNALIEKARPPKPADD